VVTATEKMLWGSLGAVYRRCGQPTCHCVSGEKHGPVFYLTRNEGGHTRTGTRTRFLPIHTRGYQPSRNR